MKNRMVQAYMGILLVLVLIFFGGCAAEEEQVQKAFEVPRDGLHIENDSEAKYVRIDYDLTDEYRVDDTYGLVRNITGTSGAYGGDVAGATVIRNSDTFARTIKVLEWQLQRENGLAVMWEETYRTAELEFDRDFFYEYDVLVLDICVQGALQVTAYPVITAMENEKIAVDFYYGARISTTASNFGTAYFIAIPKGYTDVDINWIQVEEWTEYHNPTPF